MTSRRDFLKFGLAVTAVSVLPACVSWQSEPWFVSCCTDKSGVHYVAAFTQQGALINQLPIPARGHQVIGIESRPGHALVFARRPGNFLLEVDFTTGTVVKQIDSVAGQHFFGHGVVTADQQYLLTSENDYDNGRGLIVVRDLATLEQLDKFDSGGIGPHELRLMPDQKTIVVANGGILTHPSEPRKKLNLDTMEPNLSYLSLADGKVLGAYELDNKHLSIRHLDVAENGKVVVGLQYQGAKNDLTKLVVSHHGEDSLTNLIAPESIWRQMNQYTASVAIDSSANKVAVACPRGDMLTFWQLDSGEFLQSHRLSDGAGVTTSNKTFVATNGKGQMFNANLATKQLIAKHSGLKWDNHLSRISS